MNYSQTISEKRNKIEKVFLLSCLVSLIIACLLGICLGSVRISVSEFLTAILSGNDTVNSRIICAVRIPRVLSA